ncbi:hypothetical protein Bbelb_036370 [Branchiostoma belcheri]|nr:hypothetical protein Bbelb_036370 [Branchiostoma belcheri]
MVIDKTAATTEAVPRAKTAFEHQENKVSRSGCFQPTLGLGAHNNVAITTQGSDMHFTSSTVQMYYYSARLKSGVVKTMLPLVCWNCGEEETLPIPAEKTAAYQSINPVCQTVVGNGQVAVGNGHEGRAIVVGNVLSNSVSCALVMQGRHDTESNRKLISMMDRFFDCLNVKNALQGARTKKADLD